VKALEGADRRRSLEDWSKLGAAPHRLGDAAGRQDHRRDHRRTGQLLSKGDASSMAATPFQETMSAAPNALRAKGIAYLDVGTSGGVWGLERGYCMMIGGDKAAVDRLDPIFSALAPGAATIPRRPIANSRSARHRRLYACGPAGRGPFRQDGA
jgi:6-phosphogluconate dehydrogenase (decarboxylating)